ncbi:MAG: hypothetical protein E7123_09290, partial [Bacteroidales bacterium]|nr:hypothetical protein [Bacteroidales bacterium]
MKVRQLILTASVLLASCTPVLDDEKESEKKPEQEKPVEKPTGLDCIPVVMEEFRELYHPTPAVGVYINDHA